MAWGTNKPTKQQKATTKPPNQQINKPTNQSTKQPTDRQTNWPTDAPSRPVHCSYTRLVASLWGVLQPSPSPAFRALFLQAYDDAQANTSIALPRVLFVTFTSRALVRDV
eukprot:350051-Chlamydomonas_euryale.AAC.6